MFKSNKYITLKEAAKISGYAPDYIGQLIRKGKLPGKQIYSNIAWVTSEQDLVEYLKKDKRIKQNPISKNKFFNFWVHLKIKIIHKLRLVWLLRIGLYSFIIFLIFFVLVLFYIFSVSIEKKLEEKTLQKINQSNVQY